MNTETHWTSEALNFYIGMIKRLNLVQLEIVRECGICGEKMNMLAGAGFKGKAYHLECMKKK